MNVFEKAGLSVIVLAILAQIHDPARIFPVLAVFFIGSLIFVFGHEFDGR